MSTAVRAVMVFLLALAWTGALHAQPAEPIRLGMIEGLSGPLAIAGEAVARNLQFAIRRINTRGGVQTAWGVRPLEPRRYDAKGQVEEALLMLRRAVDDGVSFVLQGNSSAMAGTRVDAINRHDEHEPDARLFLLNCSAVDSSLTNERRGFRHFRFEAHADRAARPHRCRMARPG